MTRYCPPDTVTWRLKPGKGGTYPKASLLPFSESTGCPRDVWPERWGLTVATETMLPPTSPFRSLQVAQADEVS